jgi:hypothetical protein
MHTRYHPLTTKEDGVRETVKSEAGVGAVAS